MTIRFYRCTDALVSEVRVGVLTIALDSILYWRMKMLQLAIIKENMSAAGVMDDIPVPKYVHFYSLAHKSWAFM